MRYTPGLSDAEVRDIEGRFAFRFPPDLRWFLQQGVPTGDAFPDWRGVEESIRERLRWPLDGMCFDIEHNGFWLPAWGERPKELEAAFAIAERAVADAPKLIPIYIHRYLPDRPHAAGNPVLSVYQTDIIHYGADLSDYFRREFGLHLNLPNDLSDGTHAAEAMHHVEEALRADAQRDVTAWLTGGPLPPEEPMAEPRGIEFWSYLVWLNDQPASHGRSIIPPPGLEGTS